MNMHPNGKLNSRGMVAVLVAQFLSALADNALLFSAIALLKIQGYAPWVTPLLQEFFVLAYIVLAPFVGPFADSLPKGRVMLYANGIKLFGAGAMIMGAHPLLAYALVGVGAATYSPAKYGILTQLVGPEKLVKANGMMEGSTIVAILLGAVAGGLLADYSVPFTLIAVACCYAVAAVSNLFIPKLPPSHPLTHVNLRLLFSDFWRAVKRLYQMHDTRFSLIGTSVFWGAGSTLRFLLVAWVPVALLLLDNKTPANLSGVVAIGMALGAIIAARYISLTTVNRALWGGIALGLLVFSLGFAHNLNLTMLILVLVGAAGGVFVVPLNALLQARSEATVGSGHAIAVQNFSENLSMLTLIALYTFAIHSGLSVLTIAQGFGLLLTIGFILLTVYRHLSLRTIKN